MGLSCTPELGPWALGVWRTVMLRERMLMNERLMYKQPKIFTLCTQFRGLCVSVCVATTWSSCLAFACPLCLPVEGRQHMVLHSLYRCAQSFECFNTRAA